MFFDAEPPTGFAFRWGRSQDVKQSEPNPENSVAKMVHLSLLLGMPWSQRPMLIFAAPHPPSKKRPSAMVGKEEATRDFHTGPSIARVEVYKAAVEQVRERGTASPRARMVAGEQCWSVYLPTTGCSSGLVLFLPTTLPLAFGMGEKLS